MTKFLVLSCALLLIPMAATAAPSPADWSPPILTTAAPVFSFAALSDCTANCQDGTTRTCSGSQCSARDAFCSTQTRGYCWSDVEGYKYCPVCEPEPCANNCDAMNGQFCKFGGTCETLINGTCRTLSCGCVNFHYVCP